jgi:hypothetical protein
MRTNLGLKNGNPQTDANRRLTRLENLIQQVPGRPMVVQDNNAILDTYQVQEAHGFAVGDVINWDGTSWGKAQGNTADDGIWNGVVSVVYGPNAFDITYAGIFTSKTALSFTPGDLYYLSSTTAGLAVNPVDTGSVFQSPVFMCIDENTIQVFPCAAVSAPVAQDNANIVTSSGTVTIPVGATQLTLILISNGGNGGATSGSAPYAFNGGGGGAGSMIVMCCDASDITGSITVTIGGHGVQSSVSFTFQGQAITLIAYPGNDSSAAVGASGGVATLAYAGTSTPAVYAIQGATGQSATVTAASGTGISTNPGHGAPGWCLGIGTPMPIYGNGGDGHSLTTNSGGPAVFALLY